MYFNTRIKSVLSIKYFMMLHALWSKIKLAKVKVVIQKMAHITNRLTDQGGVNNKYFTSCFVVNL